VLSAPDIPQTSTSGLAASQGKVLIVSPHFPPSTLAGVHRARHLAKHLPSHGWHPIVIRADERYYTEAPDPSLAALVPGTVEQIRTGAFPATLARTIGVGDIGLRAFRPIARAIEEGIALHAPRAILITGSPYYPMLMAGRIKRKWNVPVVLDFQDPWVSADGARASRWSKGRMAHRLAVALEPRAVRQAAWITSVSDTQNAEMAARYSWLNAERMSAIPIGGDPDDLVAMRAAPPKNMNFSLELDRINLCYVGTFLPRAAPIVRTLFEAVALLRQQHPRLAERVRLVFVGTSNQPTGSVAAADRVRPIAAEIGVDGLVREHAARVPFLEALALLGNAHGLLLLGSDEPHYTASKIYPALMSGRPYLSIFHEQSSSHHILTQAGGGATFAFGDQARLSELVPVVASGLARLAEQPDGFGHADPESYAPYTACAVAGRFADVFNRIAG
jgi:hypothetical protein